MTLSSRLNFSQKRLNDESIMIRKNSGVNFYDTLRMYCADNDIDISSVDDSDFDSAATIIEEYAKDVLSIQKYYFWIDRTN
jgi:hypothetical protein